MDAHTTGPAFALDPALENEPPLGGIRISDDETLTPRYTRKAQAAGAPGFTDKALSER